jgi:coat protein Gp5
MANRILTPKVFANTMLKLLKNNLVMGQLVTTEFKNDFKKVGDTVSVKRPPQFVIRRGRVAQVQDVVVGEAQVKLDYQCGIDLEFTSIEETLSVDELLMDQTMQSKAATLAQEIDSTLMEATMEFPDWVGTPGETINSAQDFFKGPERLDDKAVPGNMRAGILATRDYWATAGSYTAATYFDNDINRTALQRARLPMMGNVQPYMSQSVINLVTGTRAAAGASLVNGGGQAVAYIDVADSYEQTINIDGLAAGATIKRGEVFTIGTLGTGSAVQAVNPATKATLDYLQQFTVLDDYVANGGGQIANMRFANPIITTGAYQTVNQAPADNAPITWMGAPTTSYRQNAVFHKSAIALTYAKLTRPRTGEYAYSTDPETGVTIRYWQTSDGTNDTHLHRWDVLFGVTNVDRRLGTRVSGTA